MIRDKLFVLTGNSPAAASTALIAGMTEAGLARHSFVRIDAILLGGTGGTLDVYLQRKIVPVSGGTPTWIDWAHFPQIAAGASHKYTLYACQDFSSTSIVEVGQLSDDLSTGALFLPVNTFTGGLPGDAIRAIAVAGAGTSAGAAQTIYLTGGELHT